MVAANPQAGSPPSLALGFRPSLVRSTPRWLGCPQLGVVGFRLRGRNQAIAVRVDPPKLLTGAEELPTRHVAVAVEIHLAEPQRSPRLRGPDGRTNKRPPVDHDRGTGTAAKQ